MKVTIPIGVLISVVALGAGWAPGGEVRIGDGLLIRGDRVETIETPDGPAIRATGNALAIRDLEDPHELRIATPGGVILYRIENRDLHCEGWFIAERSKRLYEVFSERLVRPPKMTFHADGKETVFGGGPIFIEGLHDPEIRKARNRKKKLRAKALQMLADFDEERQKPAARNKVNRDPGD